MKKILHQVCAMILLAFLTSNLFFDGLVYASETDMSMEEKEINEVEESENVEKEEQNISEEGVPLEEKQTSEDSVYLNDSFDQESEESQVMDDGSQTETLTDNRVGVRYRTHVQYRGWQEERRNGETAGT